MIDARTVIEQRYLTALERRLEGGLPDAWRDLAAPEGIRRGAAGVMLRLAGEPTVEAMLEILEKAAAELASPSGETSSGDESRKSPRQQTRDLWSGLQKLLRPFAEPIPAGDGADPEPEALLDSTDATELVEESLYPLENLAEATESSPRLDSALRREIAARLLRARARVWADEAREEERARTTARRPSSNPETHR